MDDVEQELAALEDAAPETDDEELEIGSEDSEEPVEQQAKKHDTPLPPEELKARNADLQRALKAERRRVQEIEDRYEERFQAALARLTPKQEAQLETKLDLDGIDPDQDPMAALKALAGVVKGYKQEAERMTAQQQQEQQRSQAEQNLIGAIDKDAKDFAEDTPDYYNAQSHYVNARFAMLESAGYDKNEATQAIKFELMQIGAKALSGRRSPAEAIYKAAQAIGYGYKAPETKGKEKIDQLNAASKAGSKMAGGGSSGTSGGLTMKQIVGLKGAAFDKAMDAYLRG